MKKIRALLRRLPPWAWAGLLPVLLGAPFVGRAYFVDDHYHLLMARGLLEHPLRPYDFVADDAGPAHRGWERGQPPRMVNPPVHHYLLALLWKLTGGHLALVRFLSLFLSGISAVCLYFLARRFVVPPGPAVALSALTPALWLSSYALLIDTTLLLFFLGGLLCWIEGLHRRSGGALGAAGVLMGLAFLTKYTALFLLPLAFLYWAMDPEFRRRPKALSAFLIPLAFYGGWSVWNWATYGADHFTESSKRVAQSFSFSHLLVFLTFLGGVFVLPLSAWGAVRGRGLWGVGGLSAAAVLFLAGPWGGFSLGQAFLLVLLAGGGVLFLWEATRTALRSPFPGDRFLWVWLLVGAVQMAGVMQWVAARYFLTLLPPVVFLALRRWEGLYRGFPVLRTRRFVQWAGIVGGLGLGLAVGDGLQAETFRWVLRDVTRDRWLQRAPAGFVLADSFTGSMLTEAGWRPAFESTEMPPGALLLRSEVMMPRWWFRPRGLTPVAVYEYPSRWPLRVMDNRGSAGFYASAWGALPFALTRGPLDRYVLYQVTPPPSGPEPSRRD